MEKTFSGGRVDWAGRDGVDLGVELGDIAMVRLR